MFDDTRHMLYNYFEGYYQMLRIINSLGRLDSNKYRCNDKKLSLQLQSQSNSKSLQSVISQQNLTLIIFSKIRSNLQFTQELIEMHNKPIHSVSKGFLLITIIIILISPAKSAFNTSICGYVQNNGLYYFINGQQSDSNVIEQREQNGAKYKRIYNYCHQVQYWCSKQNNIVTGHMIIIDSGGSCFPFVQNNLELIDSNNASSGLTVTYESTLSPNPATTFPGNLTSVVMTYPCTSSQRIGCPQVCKTTIWTYFSRNSIGYTVAIQIIGVMFMVLGIYVYRATLVIIGWSTAFIVLLAIEQSVVFVPGVPEQNLADVMIITIISSFFVGYVLAYFPKAGLFCMGMWIGLIISLILNNVVLYLIYSTPENLPLYIVLPILCLGFGILTLFIKRKFIVFATSLIGAYICLRALSWHLGAFPNELLFPQQYQLGLKGVVAWQFYLYVVALLILTISSSALQFWLFKKKMQKNRKNVDIEEHFNNMGGNEVQKIFEFQNPFKNLKQTVKTKGPRVLKKSQDWDQYEVKKDRTSYDEDEASYGEENKQQEQEQPSQKPQRDYGLKQNLLNKNKRRN